MTLSRSQARSFYDHFGRKQDAQAFYEDAALNELVAHAAFEQAENVFELGCGTGRFALTLLAKHLPPSATYLGSDLSQTMIDIAQQRISRYMGRAGAVHSNGSMHFPLPGHSADRVVATYVFDLLSETDIREAISEAHRVLIPGGKLCLVGLTTGINAASRIVSALWSGAFRLHASLVGGCRPIRLGSYLDQDTWSIEYRTIVTPFGVPSEVLVATLKSTPNNSLEPAPKDGAAER